MTGSTDNSDVLAAARELAPLIIEAREQAERQRRILPAVSQHLAAAGLYQMFLPPALGGRALPPAAVFDVIEVLSAADASAGWCVMNANLIALAAGWLAPEVGRQCFGQPPDLRGAGSLRPQGRAAPVSGGFQVNGRWNFASGLHDANWLFCPCVVVAGPEPTRLPDGAPVTRTMWVPAAAARPIDTWSVMGMRATGSHDFELENHFVPTEHSINLAEAACAGGPLFDSRCFIALAHTLFAANALGIARSSIEALIAMAVGTASTMSPMLLRDRPAVQARLAQAEAIAASARCYVRDALDRLWTALCAGEPDPGGELGRLRLAIVHAIHESVRAVDLVFHAAGTNAIHTANPLERQFRDIHVAAQHGAAFPVHYESAGKVLLGLRPTEPGW
jgi:indole-3-acetate monooxygenase